MNQTPDLLSLHHLQINRRDMVEAPGPVLVICQFWEWQNGANLGGGHLNTFLGVGSMTHSVSKEKPSHQPWEIKCS